MKTMNSSSLAASNVKDPMASKTCGANYRPGKTLVHRLTNDEYNNTVRDLVFTSSRPADAFAPGVPGPSGYTNDSATLLIDEVLAGKYFDAANALAAEVMASKSTSGGAYDRISPCARTATAATRASCTQTTVKGFGLKAFRRPLTDVEVNQMSAIFNLGSTFDEGLQNFIAASLINPKFLYVSVVNPISQMEGATFALDNYQLASRLSYFLWQSMPDAELLQAAADGSLSSDSVLASQTRRMLADARSVALSKILRDEWLSAGKLSLPIANLADGIRTAMIKETDLVLQDVLRNDRPFSQLFSANSTFANKALADYYGLPFTGTDVNAFVRVNYDSNRIGILSHGSFLTATGGMSPETSIVKRGKAVADRILCAPNGPPPVPPADPNKDPALTGNPRQRLIQATSSVGCIGCHSSLNNLGFGLNNFNSFGQVRTRYTDYNEAIDTSGTVPGLISFANGHDMLSQIGTLNAVRSCFSRQLISIATTRAMNSVDDLCVADVVGQNTAGTKFSDTIVGIVQSRLFRMQTGEAP